MTAAVPQDYTVDFGYKPGGTGQIGDTVFEDKNNNGIFDGGDAGIQGAQVILYEDHYKRGRPDGAADASFGEAGEAWPRISL